LLADILDLVLSSEEGIIEDLEVLERFSNSDHKIVKFKLVASTTCNHSTQVRYDFNKGNYEDMNRWLSDISWGDLFQYLDVNFMWVKFNNIHHDAMNKFILIQKLRKRKYPTWMTRYAKKACTFKSLMWNRYPSSSFYNDRIEYKRARNMATNEFRIAKISFEKKLAKTLIMIQNHSIAMYDQNQEQRLKSGH